MARAAPPDRHGFFSLGTNADYVARFLGEIPVFLEVEPEHAADVRGEQRPREPDRRLVRIDRARCSRCCPLAVTDLDRRIAELVAERIPDHATIQVGIGGVPNALLGLLEPTTGISASTPSCSTDGLVDLIESGAATGLSKTTRPGKVVTTFALGTQKTYDYIADNPVVEMLPVDWVNDPRVIGREPHVRLDQRDASRSTSSASATRRSSTGATGPAAAARRTSPEGAMHSPEGQGFIVVPHSTRRRLDLADRSPALTGAAVTTDKNTVDKVVTEYGVAELRGRHRRRAHAAP